MVEVNCSSSEGKPTFCWPAFPFCPRISNMLQIIFFFHQPLDHKTLKTIDKVNVDKAESSTLKVEVQKQGWIFGFSTNKDLFHLFSFTIEKNKSYGSLSPEEQQKESLFCTLWTSFGSRRSLPWTDATTASTTKNIPGKGLLANSKSPVECYQDSRRMPRSKTPKLLLENELTTQASTAFNLSVSSGTKVQYITG